MTLLTSTRSHGPREYNNTDFLHAFLGSFMAYVITGDPNHTVGETITPRWEEHSIAQKSMVFNRTENGEPWIHSVSAPPDIIRRCAWVLSYHHRIYSNFSTASGKVSVQKRSSDLPFKLRLSQENIRPKCTWIMTLGYSGIIHAFNNEHIYASFYHPLFKCSIHGLVVIPNWPYCHLDITVGYYSDGWGLPVRTAWCWWRSSISTRSFPSSEQQSYHSCWIVVCSAWRY